MWWIFAIVIISFIVILQVKLRLEFSFTPVFVLKARFLFFSFSVYPKSSKKKKERNPTQTNQKKTPFVAVKEALSIENLLDKSPKSLSLRIERYRFEIGSADPFKTFQLHTLLMQTSVAVFSILSCIFPRISVQNVSVTPSFFSPCFHGDVKGEISLSVCDFMKLVLQRYK